MISIVSPEQILPESQPLQDPSTYQRLRPSLSLTNENQFRIDEQKQGRCEKYFHQKYVSYRRFKAGRNAAAVWFQFVWTIAMFIYGIFDQVKSWIYYFIYTHSDQFASSTLQHMMLFFLIAKVTIQVLAWSIIFSELYVAEKEARYYNVEALTIKEKKFINYMCKLAYYNFLNLSIVLAYSFIAILPAILMTICQLTRTFPYLVHWVFAIYFKTILTKDLITNLRIDEIKQNLFDKNVTKVKGIYQIAQDEQTQLFYQKKKQKADKMIHIDQLENQNQLSKIISDSIALDANIQPNLQTLFFEADIEKYQKLSNTLQALFEALPQAILQFINNQEFYQKTCVNAPAGEKCIDNWDSLFTKLAFASSIFTIVVYCTSLIIDLFKEDISILWNQFKKLKLLSEKKNLLTEKDRQTLATQYTMPSEYTIIKRSDMLKLQNLQQDGLNKLQKIEFLFEDLPQDSEYLLESFDFLSDRLNYCQELTLDLGGARGNNLKEKEIFSCMVYILKFIQKSKRDQLILNIKFNNNQFHYNELQHPLKENLIIRYANSLQVTQFTISLKSCQMADQDLRYFIRILKNLNNLAVLSIDCSCNFIHFENISEQDTELQQREGIFKGLCHLKIDLSENHIAEIGARNLFHQFILRFEKLKSLDISLNKNLIADDKGLQLTNMSSQELQQVSLDFSDQLKKPAKFEEHCSYQDIGHGVMKEIIPNDIIGFLNSSQGKIEELRLNFSQIQLNNQILQNLMKMPIFSNLQKIQFRFPKVNTFDTNILNQLIESIKKCANLKELLLDLRNVQFVENQMLGKYVYLFKNVQMMTDQFTEKDLHMLNEQNDCEDNQHEEVKESAQQMPNSSNALMKNQYVATIIERLASAQPKYFIMKHVDSWKGFKQSVSFLINTKFLFFINSVGQIDSILECMDESEKNQELQVFKLNKLNEVNNAYIGRFSQDSKPPKDIMLKSRDSTVSRNHLLISYDGKNPFILSKLQEKVNIYNVFNNSRWQVPEEANIGLGQGVGQITLNIMKLSTNSHIDNEDIKNNPSRFQNFYWATQLILTKGETCKSEEMFVIKEEKKKENDDISKTGSTTPRNQEDEQEKKVVDGYIEIDSSEIIGKRPAQFILKPGQFITIGKGNMCDVRLKEKRPEEEVIADVHCIIRYDTLFQHNQKVNAFEDKSYSTQRENQCKDHWEVIKQYYAKKGCSGNQINQQNAQNQTFNQKILATPIEQVITQDLKPYFYIEKQEYNALQTNDTTLEIKIDTKDDDNKAYQMVKNKQQIKIGFSAYEFDLSNCSQQPIQPEVHNQ